MKRQQNYYDIDLRFQRPHDNDSEQRNNREILHYGDESYLELDSVGQVDDIVDFTSMSEVSFEKSKENKPGKHSTSKDIWISDETADTSVPEGRVNSSEDDISGHYTQRMDSNILYDREGKSSKSFKDDSAVSFVNRSCNELHASNEEYRKNRKRKRLGKQEEKEKVKSKRLTEPTHCLENNIPHSHTTLNNSQDHIYVSHTPLMPFASSEITFDSMFCFSLQKNSSNDRKEGQKDDDDYRQVCLKKPMEMSGPLLDDLKYIHKSSDKNTRKFFFKEDTQKEVFRRNLKEAPKEIIDQLAKEVYKALILAEENDMQTKHAMKITRNNESIQIDFENEDELMFLLQSHDDKFVLKPALGKILISPRTDIKICQAFTKDQSITHDCTDLHICKYFLLGECSLRHCKFSHRLTSKHNKKALREHDLEGLPEKAVKVLVRSIHNRNISTTPLICKFYNNEGGCQKGTMCMHIHLCMHYVNGNCKFGYDCKRSHDIFEQQTRNILERHGLSEDSNKDDIINLLKATLQEGQVKLKRDYLPSLSQRSPNILSSECTAQPLGKASAMAKVLTMSLEGSKENKKPEDTVKTSRNPQDSARLPDYIPLGQDEMHCQPKCLDNDHDFSKDETKILEVNAKGTHTDKHFLPAWTPIWPAASKKPIEENKLITEEKSQQDVCETAARTFSAAVVKDTSATKGTPETERFLNENDGHTNKNLKDLEQTDNKLMNIHTETAIDGNTSNCSEPTITQYKETAISKTSNPLQDSQEINSDNSNITAVILEVTEKNASYKIRKNKKQWQFEDNIKQWVTLGWQDSESLNKLFRQFIDHSRQAISQALSQTAEDP